MSIYARVTSHYARVTSHYVRVESHYTRVTSHYVRVDTHYVRVISRYVDGNSLKRSEFTVNSPVWIKKRSSQRASKRALCSAI